jgi:sialate O-acetylesterase
MEGVGDLADVIQPQPLVHSFDMSDHWGIASEPLHTLPGATDRVHWRRNEKGEPQQLTGERLAQFTAARRKGAGLGLPFAVEMLRRSGVPIGLVPCAHGGTSMDQWDPALKDKGGDSLYGAMLRRFRATGGKVKGLLWYQGESDANPKAVGTFAAKFDRLVKSIRDDFGQPELPFYYVQIGRHVNTQNIAEWNQIQEAQRNAEATIPRTGVVAAVDLSLDDGIHVSTPDLKRLGRRLANLASHDLFPGVKEYVTMKRGPRPVSAKFENGTIRVTFTEVNGSLLSEGRLSGFTIHNEKGEIVPMIYKQRFDPADPSVVVLQVQGKLPEKASLWYGYGKDPYCNLRDTADMAAPVFGPMPIQ